MTARRHYRKNRSQNNNNSSSDENWSCYVFIGIIFLIIILYDLFPLR